MVGNNSASVLVDAYMKGVRVEEVESLYKGLLHGTENVHPEVSSTGRLGYKYYNRLGYIPYDVNINENAARTLEYAYDDWCIYRLAKEYMDKSGNLTQWKPGHPNRAVLEADIAKGNSYVCEEDGQLHAAFALILGDDPTYQVIEEGKWLEDSPYGTIHRLASDGQIKGIFAACVSFCQNICPHLLSLIHISEPTRH